MVPVPRVFNDNIICDGSSADVNKYQELVVLATIIASPLA